MHKRKLKRNTFTQGIKTPENNSRLKDHLDDKNDSCDYFQLPSLQKKTTWKDEDNVSTCDQYSTATDIFCSSEIENIATRKVMQQWEAIENTLYEDGEPVSQAAILEECIQWQTQIPHLRVIGKNPFISNTTDCQDLGINRNQRRTSFNSQNENIDSEVSPSIKGRKISSKQKLQKAQQDEIFEMLYQYVISELFPSKEIADDSLNDEFNNVLQIRTARFHSNKSSAKSTKLNWIEEKISLENRFPSSHKAVENCGIPVRKETAPSKTQEHQKKYDNLLHVDKAKCGRNDSTMDDKLFRPHTSRNKLGTVFNEKIVVSPVPYVLSTRESFSTVKTTPIKFMAQSFNVSTAPGSSKNIDYFTNLGKNSTSAKISNYQSTWHTPVSPAVWPKNIKLAPLDTSRLQNSKNRFATSSSVTLQRNRKSLSPISRPIPPVSAQTPYNTKSEVLEIQGRHISPGQSSKLSSSTTHWENAGSSKNMKKKSHAKVRP